LGYQLLVVSEDPEQFLLHKQLQMVQYIFLLNICEEDALGL
jgi:hypothetical protein